MKPYVSIIVPVYNTQNYLEKCVDSLTQQTLHDIEIILVDDGSADGCPALCDMYSAQDARIKVVHRQNGGLGMARNSGIEIATGEYIAFVDSDDYVSPEMYASMITQAEKYGADCCFCSGEDVYEKAGVSVPFYYPFRQELYVEREIIQNILPGIVGSEPKAKIGAEIGMSVWRAIYSRKIIMNNKIRFLSERQFISEDILFNVDYFLHSNRVTAVDGTYYHYIQHQIAGSTLTTSYRADRFEKSKALYFELIKKTEHLSDISEIKLRIDRTFISYARVSIMSEAMFAQKNGKRKCLKSIEAICRDETLQNVLRKYPIGESPTKQRIFSHLMAWNRPRLLYLLAKLNRLTKKGGNV